MSYLLEIQELLEGHFQDGSVQVSDLTGTQDHLDIIVTSQVFANKPLLQQHQMVMDVLKDKFADKLHAVKIKTQIKES